MKKLLSLILIFFIAGCATTQSKKPDPYADVSVKNIKNNCQPSESWNVGVLGIPAFVLLFQDCLKVEALLVVTLDTEAATDKIRRHSLDLLSLHYVEYLKRSNDKNITWHMKKIKEEENKGWLTYLFDITNKKNTCTKDKCKPEETND